MAYLQTIGTQQHKKTIDLIKQKLNKNYKSCSSDLTFFHSVTVGEAPTVRFVFVFILIFTEI
jgi:hypothetical protein